MEFLKEYLGEELYAKVAEKLSGNDKVKLANLASGDYVSKRKLEEAEEKSSELSNQITERDKQLEELKKSTNTEEFNKTINELTEANKKQAEEYEHKLSERERNYLLETELSKSGAKNLKALKGLLDMEKVTVKDGKIDGLSEQIDGLKASDGYLFNATNNNGAGLDPEGSGNPPKESKYAEFHKMI